VKNKIFFYIALFAVSTTLPVFAKYVEPASGGKSCMLVGGKTAWKYTLVDSENSTEWRNLTADYVYVYIRAPKDDGSDFQIYIDGKKYKKASVVEKPSKKYEMRIEDANPKPVTTSKKMKIKLAKGMHSVELKTDEKIYVRLVTVPRKASAITPEEYGKSLSLVAGDNLTTYYTADASNSVVVKYEGSGTLTVWSRLAFDKKMKGTQHYVVAAMMGKKTIRAKLETIISETSTWENDGEVITGKARTFKIDLPKGSNEIRFFIEDTTAPFCGFRFTVR